MNLYRRVTSRRATSAAAGAAAVLLCAQPVLALGDVSHPDVNLTDLTLEDLARVEVTSVSKRPEPLSGAADSVFVIGREDVIRSGAVSLPETLRLAPNLQVARIDAFDYAISARGLNGFEQSNKLLVLIDGCSVWTPLYGGVEWDQQNVMLEDLERIEVISGPGGALWGSNAMNGVVNVLTRSAFDTRGGLVSLRGGPDEKIGAARLGFALGERAAGRVWGQAWRRGDLLRRDAFDPNDGWSGWQLGFRTDAAAGVDHFTLQGDYQQADVDRPGYGDLDRTNLLARWTRRSNGWGTLQVQAYVDDSNRQSRWLRTELRIYDVQAQHSLRLGERHDLVWGVGHRVSSDDFENLINPFVLDPLARTIHITNAFVQDEIALRHDLALVLGLKFEESSYVGGDWMPTARLAWRPTDRTLIWAAASRVTRTPSRIERDLVFPGLVENDVFSSEKLVAYELGWRGRGERATASVNLFRHEYDDVRTNELQPGGGLPLFVGNGMRGEV